MTVDDIFNVMSAKAGCANIGLKKIKALAIFLNMLFLPLNHLHLTFPARVESTAADTNIHLGPKTVQRRVG
jgi:hypothetical protein